MVDHNTHNPLLPLRQHITVILAKEIRKDFATSRNLKVQEKNYRQRDICLPE